MRADITGVQTQTIAELAGEGAGLVLDIGCGDGNKTAGLSSVAKRVVGMDPDESRIRAACRRRSGGNIFFHVGSGEALPFRDAAFNAVVFSESLHHIPSRHHDAALAEADRVLAPGGRLLILEPVVDKGTFEDIFYIYDDEREERKAALAAVDTLSRTFKRVLAREIQIQYACEGFDDLCDHNIVREPETPAQNEDKQKVMDILARCERTVDGEYIIDYYSNVWLFERR